MPNVNTQYKGAFTEGKGALGEFWKSIMRRSNYEQTPQYEKEVEEYVKAAQEEADKRNMQQQNIQQQRVQQQMRYGAKPSIQPPVTPSQNNQQDVALKKLESGSTVLPSMNLPGNDVAIKNYIAQLFATVSQCWNPDSVKDENIPTWYKGREKSGEDALAMIRRTWVRAADDPSDIRAKAGYYYILDTVLRNPPAWLNPSQIQLFKDELVKSGIRSMDRLANLISDTEGMIQTNEAAGIKPDQTIPSKEDTNVQKLQGKRIR